MPFLNLAGRRSHASATRSASSAVAIPSARRSSRLLRHDLGGERRTAPYPRGAAVVIRPRRSFPSAIWSISISSPGHGNERGRTGDHESSQRRPRRRLPRPPVEITATMTPWEELPGPLVIARHNCCARCPLGAGCRPARRIASTGAAAENAPGASQVAQTGVSGEGRETVRTVARSLAGTSSCLRRPLSTLLGRWARSPRRCAAGG